MANKDYQIAIFNGKVSPRTDTAPDEVIRHQTSACQFVFISYG